MFAEPIDLTRREKEVAAMLLTGYTRPEIASALRISGETVKKHTSNIVRKCNAANQREAASVLQMHEFIYGETGLDADFFVLLRDSRILIDDDARTSHLRNRSVQVCCKDNIVEQEEGVYSDGDIEQIQINDETASAIRKERGRCSCKHTFPPLHRGEIVERTLTARLKDGFCFPRGYFFLEQQLPCKVLRIWVEFGPRFRIAMVDFEAKLGTHIYTPYRERRHVDERSIEWVVEEPKVLSCFTMRWLVTDTNSS